MAEPATEVERDLNAAIDELRGLRRGRTKDGSPIGADDALWKAFVVVLGQAFIARAEVDYLRARFDQGRGDHAELAGIVARVAETARDVAAKVADGSVGAAVLKVSYVPSRTGETTLPPAVVVPKGAAQ